MIFLAIPSHNFPPCCLGIHQHPEDPFIYKSVYGSLHYLSCYVYEYNHGMKITGTLLACIPDNSTSRLMIKLNELKPKAWNLSRQATTVLGKLLFLLSSWVGYQVRSHYCCCKLQLVGLLSSLALLVSFPTTSRQLTEFC